MNVYATIFYTILIMAAVYGLYQGLVKTVQPIITYIFSFIVMFFLKSWTLGFIFKWALFSGENVIARVIVVLLFFFGGSLLFRWIFNVLDIISKLPVIRGFNRILGLAFGTLEGLLIVWLIMYVTELFPTTPMFASCITDIQGMPLLPLLYENNLVKQLIELFVVL